MRRLFLLLLLANVTFFAVTEFELGWGEKSPQGERPLHPELIQLRDTHNVEPRALSTAKRVDKITKRSPDPSVNSEKNKLFCLEWGDFSGENLKKTILELSKLKLGDKLQQREIEQGTGFWVYMPPLKNRTRVKMKIHELKNLGVHEYYVISDKGKWKNAISLGIFKTQAAAQNLHEKLKTQGVRSARTGERASKLISTQFILNGVRMEIKDKLIGLQKNFKGSELNDIPCTLTK